MTGFDTANVSEQLEKIDARIERLETIVSILPIGPRDLSKFSSVAAIICMAAELWEVSPRDILSDRRDQLFAVPRFAVSWTARNSLPHSLPMIGRALGHRDPTTIMHHIRRADRIRSRDPLFRERTDTMLASIEASQRSALLRLQESVDA